MNEASQLADRNAVATVLNPRSIAIVGMSAKAGSVGRNILKGLQLNHFSGDIHLVGRSTDPIDGIEMLQSVESLPMGVDLAVLVLPASAIAAAIEECISRKVRSALVFAAGFAELGEHSAQEQVAAMARDGGLALVGPNCIGFTNNVDGMMIHMVQAREAGKWTPELPQGVAFVGQSGGLLGHMQRAAGARNMPITYVASTGNEAGLDLADFTDFLVDDAATGLIVLYAEQIRRPQAFLRAAERARKAGKPVVLMHPGRSSKAREAAASHTGSLVGDYGAMAAQVKASGILLVNELDELMDVSEILLRFPVPATKGPAILTGSGAFVALANDFVEDSDLDFPALAESTVQKIQPVLPGFGTVSNPLDLTASVTHESISISTRALLDDPETGSLLISFPIDGRAGLINSFVEGLAGSTKPAVMVALGDTSQLSEDIVRAAAKSPAIFSRSSDRSLRALALYTAYGRTLAQNTDTTPTLLKGLPALGRGTQVEWVGKQLLKAAGVRVPKGELAVTEEQALKIASDIGYPVVMKAQSSELAHKTEAGGVMLNIGDASALRDAWQKLDANVKRAAPGVKLDGVLVEQMCAKGLELMIGAKRDAGWGPVLLLGLGGIWVEALGDVRIMSANSSEATIRRELMKLRSAKLMTGFRGAPPVDIDAVVKTVSATASLMLTNEDIVEIDINPLLVHPAGEGVTALDALIVTR